MDILYWFHLLIMILFFTIPFWPYNLLKYAAYVPLILSVIWTLNGKCPLNNFHHVNNKKGNFTLDVLQIFIPNATEKLANHITMIALVLVTIFSFKNLCKK